MKSVRVNLISFILLGTLWSIWTIISLCQACLLGLQGTVTNIVTEDFQVQISLIHWGSKAFAWLSTDQAVVWLTLWYLIQFPPKRLYLPRPFAYLDNCGSLQLSSLSPSALRWPTQSRSGVYRLPEYQVWGYRSQVLWSASWNLQMISWRNWRETEPKRIYMVGSCWKDLGEVEEGDQ